ncbi:unnamed protein product [Bursaphelenchus xylophilus]|uniref:Serpentine receptor class gamma n=1 Tax=Bursaphelenchus xylophilus TaxID=6326 RepID=A0A1I7RWA7_BURXY|nr:unnamed protein product [Bursaphelenchus xylophilus]CAG9095377.1 unnamed protein product [Bursaphelenchus xylophilus]
MVIIVLIKERGRFPSVFYRLVAIFGVQEVICYLFNQYIQRWPTSEFVYIHYFYQLQIPTKIQVVWYFVYFYTQLQGVLAATILAFNRVSCILFPMHHDTMWRKNLPLVLAIYYVAPFGCYWTLLFNKGVVECDNGTGMDKQCYFTYDHSNTFGISVGNNSKYAFISLSVISGVCNFTTLFLLCLRKKSLRIRRNWKQEINLFITSFVIFLAHFAYGLVEQTVPAFYRTSKTASTLIFGVILPLLYDVVLASTVLSLIIASPKIRQEILYIFGEPFGLNVTRQTKTVTMSPSKF